VYIDVETSVRTKHRIREPCRPTSIRLQRHQTSEGVPRPPEAHTISTSVDAAPISHTSLKHPPPYAGAAACAHPSRARNAGETMPHAPELLYTRAQRCVFMSLDAIYLCSYSSRSSRAAPLRIIGLDCLRSHGRGATRCAPLRCRCCRVMTNAPRGGRCQGSSWSVGVLLVVVVVLMTTVNPRGSLAHGAREEALLHSATSTNISR
jgi:hypothetical protein